VAGGVLANRTLHSLSVIVVTVVVVVVVVCKARHDNAAVSGNAVDHLLTMIDHD
jgi:hypothetical protein